MRKAIDAKEVIKAYEAGESFHSIARNLDTYPATIYRILQRNNVELRRDGYKKGCPIVKDGEKLIEWAKAQGRLVTKTELAKIAGTKRLSPSYFIKYPELGQYVKSYEQKELVTYTDKLFNWLKENNIPYKPNDKTALEGTSVQALLLEEYNGILIIVNIKPKSMAKKRFEEMIQRRRDKIKEKGLTALYLKEEDFDDLDTIKKSLNDLKYSKEK